MDAPTVDQIIRFESGEMCLKEQVKLFAHLIETGLAFQLQGFYGRTANQMMEMELIDNEGNINETRVEEFTGE
jgi:hypothetical protein